MRLPPAATCAPRSIRSCLQEFIDVGFLRTIRRSPPDSPFNSGTVRFLNRPELRLRHHGDCRQQDRSVLTALKTQHFSCVSLPQRDLAALAYDLDLDALRGSFSRYFHAIMLSCRGADGKFERTRADRNFSMIVMEKRGDHLEAVVWSEAPTIYMDTWALNLFSRDQPLLDRFLQLFHDRGTLLISVMLAMEIGAHVAAERPELRSFLDVIGPHWVPLTIDPFAVMAAQEQPGIYSRLHQRRIHQ